MIQETGFPPDSEVTLLRYLFKWMSLAFFHFEIQSMFHGTVWKVPLLTYDKLNST